MKPPRKPSNWVSALKPMPQYPNAICKMVFFRDTNFDVLDFRDLMPILLNLPRTTSAACPLLFPMIFLTMLDIVHVHCGASQTRSLSCWTRKRRVLIPYLAAFLSIFNTVLYIMTIFVMMIIGGVETLTNNSYWKHDGATIEVLPMHYLAHTECCSYLLSSRLHNRCNVVDHKTHADMYHLLRCSRSSPIP